LFCLSSITSRQLLLLRVTHVSKKPQICSNFKSTFRRKHVCKYKIFQDSVRKLSYEIYLLFVWINGILFKLYTVKCDIKTIMLLENTTNSSHNYMQMSGSPVFPAFEIFLGCLQHKAPNISISFLFDRKLKIFFISLLIKEGFVGLYNCYYTLLSNLSYLKQFKCEAVSYLLWRHRRLGRVLYRNRLQNGWLTALVPRRNVMERIFWIVFSARANVIHNRKYFKASAVLPSELDGWSLKGRQIAGLTNSQFCAYLLVSRVADFNGSLRLNLHWVSSKSSHMSCQQLLHFQRGDNDENLAWSFSFVVPMLSWKLDCSEISYATSR